MHQFYPNSVPLTLTHWEVVEVDQHHLDKNKMDSLQLTHIFLTDKGAAKATPIPGRITFFNGGIQMRKTAFFLIAILLIIVPVTLASAEEAPQKIKDFAQSKLAEYGKDPVIVKAVAAENTKSKTLDQIKNKDKLWRETAGIDGFMKAIMENECGQYLRSIQKSKAYFAEIFVMDNQGANVAMTDKTSDYWQGDEAKFKKSFNNGTGAIFVDEVEFDDSTQVYLVQVSVPVWDNDQVIGAITFGIDVDKVE